MECPGCVAEAAKWPEEPSGPAAVDGTHSHTLLEFCIKGNYHDAMLVVGHELEDGGGRFTVDLERALRVNKVLHYIWPKIREGRMEVWAEAFVDAGQAFGIPEWGGSIDVTLLAPDFLELVDFKDGGKPVSPETNQLITYGMGVLNTLRATGSSLPSTIRCTIIQPKVYEQPRSVDYSLEEFMARVEALRLQMLLSMQPQAPKKAGDHCKYCRGAKAGRCDEFNKGASVVISEIFKTANNVVAEVASAAVPAGNGAQLHALPFQLPEINSETPVDVLAAIIDAKPLIYAIIKEAEEEGSKRALAGAHVPGHKLVNSITHRRWAKDALKQLRAMRLKADVYMEEKLKSPKAVLESDEVKSMSEKRRQKIEELVTKPTGNPVLVPESDPRPAVVKDVAQIFADVTIPLPPAPAAAPPALEATPVAPVKTPISFL